MQNILSSDIIYTLGKLSEEERHRIALWLDMLSPFFSVYEPEQQNKQLQGEKVYPTLE